MNARLTARMSGLIAVAISLSGITAQAAINLLHEFAGGAGDGANPAYTTPVISGSTLYGTTVLGGASGLGTVFKMNTDGTGFTTLREFAGATSDGDKNFGSVTLDGSTLYGMTQLGGANTFGTVFKMNTDGTGFTILRSFDAVATDGRAPVGSLTLAGSTLYGVTRGGGASNNGAVFKMNTDGTGFTLLHSFAGGLTDGRDPFSNTPILIGSTLYGMTEAGGSSDLGTMYKVNTDGTGYTILHEFAGGASDGRTPRSSFTPVGSTLYGTTTFGGDSNLGTLFKINTDGTGFSLLHEFAGGAGDGGWGARTLTLDGSTLYGMTSNGGDSDFGTLFKMNTNGSGYALLHEFSGGGSDGSVPLGAVTLVGSTFYGMTYSGGDSDLGTVFTFSEIPELGTSVLVLAGFVAFQLARRHRK